MEELKEYRRFTVKAEVDKAVSTLVGILEGITIDSFVNVVEIREFLNWCALHRKFRRKHPFYELFNIIDSVLEDGVLTEEEILDILYVCRNMRPDSQYYDLITTGVQELQGILHGIIADSKINDDEVLGLEKWLNENDYLKGTYPFSEIDSLLTAVLSDRVISLDEKEMLLAFFSSFIDLRKSSEIDPSMFIELRSKYKISGICASCPDVIIPDHWFCFTGISSRTNRKEISEIVIGRGGYFKDIITDKIQFLVVGNEGNPCWAFASYGRKVEAAMKMRQNGHPIQIINEVDFWDAVVE